MNAGTPRAPSSPSQAEVPHLGVVGEDAAVRTQSHTRAALLAYGAAERRARHAERRWRSGPFFASYYLRTLVALIPDGVRRGRGAYTRARGRDVWRDRSG